MEADSMVRTSKYNATNPLSARCLKDVVAALDIHREDFFPYIFNRNTRKMNDTIDAFHASLDCIDISHIQLAYFLARISRFLFSHVG